jgi:hypothetical protein
MSITCFVLQSLRRRECPNIAPCPCTLLIYCHFHLYQAVATLFRCHLSEALGATRVAIEAGLHVYRFLEGHGTPEEYVQGEPTFKYTVNHIRQARIKLADKFPLAERLIALHELCSRFGSHADYDSFLHRIEFTAGDVATTKLLYFQKPDSIADSGRAAARSPADGTMIDIPVIDRTHRLLARRDAIERWFRKA